MTMKLCTLADTIVIARGLGRSDRRSFDLDQATCEGEEIDLPTDPVESLINGVEKERLGVLIGLTVAQIEERGEAWKAAISAYNEGFLAE